MGTLPRPPRNGLVWLARNVYHPLGFARGYKFVLFVVFAGALTAFSLARLPYLDFNGVFCGHGVGGNQQAAPGECWHYRRSRNERVGIILHLACILPAGLLACFQFVPAIRHRALLFHRVNGYVVVVLSLLATAGALVIARNAFGGGLETQIMLLTLAMMFVASLVLSYVNVKMLQIEQHRAWMLRAWFYAGSIITLRIIMALSAIFISKRGYYTVRPCGQVQDALGASAHDTIAQYPACAAYFSGANPEQFTMVRASMTGSAIEVSAALGLGFGAAGWLALVLHAVGVEVYLQLTPAEHERLRNFSYQRQLAAGMRNPGRAGLTADRLGDAEPWEPALVRVAREHEEQKLAPLSSDDRSIGRGD